MKAIKRQEYKKFVAENIIRPYQRAISDSDTPLDFQESIYALIPELCETETDWAKKVFDRMALIYDSVEHDFFPQDEAGSTILSMMTKHGMKIRY